MITQKAASGFAIAVALLCSISACDRSPKAASPTPPAPTATIAAPNTPAAVAQTSAPDAPTPAIAVSLAPGATQQGDIPGGHDIGFLKRFRGAQVMGYLSHPYDRITAYDSSVSTFPGVAAVVEGEVTRLIYRIPVGHTALEVFRNYEDLAKSAGMRMASEIPCQSGYGVLEQQVFDQISFGRLSDPFYHVSGTEPEPARPWCYFTATASVDSRPLTLVVLVAEKHNYLELTGQDGKPLTFKDGEVVVGVDLVVAKPVANQMVTVKAADMADALAAKGVVDLYGVYFDTDKTAVKPESDATLGEVASLLKIDRSLRLEVSGHTDNAGSAAHNLTLSQGRAQAVVAAPVGRYGIDAKRLIAKGYGDTKPVAPNATEDGKAKNRRVELRKISS